MKEKIGIEKLIELLNEYCCEDEGSETKREPRHLGEGGLLSLQVISKQFGFIKWLVENEKIKWDEKFYLEDDEGLFGTYECLLMQLAIQDNPIEFLISVLKDDATEKIDKLLNGVKRTCENIGI